MELLRGRGGGRWTSISRITLVDEYEKATGVLKAMVKDVTMHKNYIGGVVMRSLVLCVAVLMFVGCATTVTPYVDMRDVKPFAGDVQVFEIGKCPGGVKVLGRVVREDVGKYQRLTLESELPLLKAEVRKLGGNGLCVDRADVVYSGIFSRGIYFEGRVVRYHD